MANATAMTHKEWEAEGERRFGPDRKQWRFVCPACGYEQSVQECLDAGVPPKAIAFSCIGRWRGEQREAFVTRKDSRMAGPCNYAGGGLFRIAPLAVKMPDGETLLGFAFAEPVSAPGQTPAPRTDTSRPPAPAA